MSKTDKPEMLTDVAIASITIGKRYRKDLGRDDGTLQQLADSIEENGLLQPVLINMAYELIAGQRRIEAYKLLGRKRILCRITTGYKDTLDAIRAEYAENEDRKAFTVEERVELAAEIERLLKPAAQMREKAGKSLGSNPTANLPQGVKNLTVKDDAAKQVGMSRRTLEAAEEVVEAAKENPKLRPVVDEMNRTGKVSPALRKVREKTQPKPEPAEPSKEPTAVEIAAANIAELAEAIKAARALARTIFDFGPDKTPQADYLNRFSYDGVIGTLTEYLRMLDDLTPLEGTPKKPITRRDVKIRESMKK